MYLAAKKLGRCHSADRPTTAIVRLVRRMRRRVAMSSAMARAPALALPGVADLTRNAAGQSERLGDGELLLAHDVGADPIRADRLVGTLASRLAGVARLARVVDRAPRRMGATDGHLAMQHGERRPAREQTQALVAWQRARSGRERVLDAARLGLAFRALRRVASRPCRGDPQPPAALRD